MNEKELLLSKVLKKEKSSFLDEEDWDFRAPETKIMASITRLGI